MKQVQENLEQYRDNRFFNSLLLEAEPNWPNKNPKDENPKDKNPKDEKGKEENSKDKNPNGEKNKKSKEKKPQNSEEKTGLTIIKKLEDNYKRFKTVAGDRIEPYKSFWDIQTTWYNRLAKNGQNFQYHYCMYDSNFVVYLNEATQQLTVLKKKLDEKETNPFLTFSSKSINIKFKDFYKFVINDMKTVKKNYKTDIENKKVNAFLKENKEVKKN